MPPECTSLPPPAKWCVSSLPEVTWAGVVFDQALTLALTHSLSLRKSSSESTHLPSSRIHSLTQELCSIRLAVSSIN